MVLVYDRALLDPRVGRLSDAAFRFWRGAIGACNALGRETLAVDEIREAIETSRATGWTANEIEECLRELVYAELARRLPHDHVRLLARLDLWAFDDEAEENVSISGSSDE